MKFKELLNEVISEARKDDLEYTFRAAKGKPSLEANDKKIARIETAISNKDLPGNMGSVFGTFAAAKKRMDIAKKEYTALDTNLREKIKEVAGDIFDEADEQITRVIETAGSLITISKATESAKLDNAKFKKLLSEYFKDNQAILDDIIKQSTKLVKVASSVKIETLGEGIVDKAKATLKKAASAVSAYLGKLKGKITGVNKKGTQLIDMAKSLTA
tara:strand:+ start:393 stop:1040 length:648 start_codon:yes stop_codon:yes gene_type:complete